MQQAGSTYRHCEYLHAGVLQDISLQILTLLLLQLSMKLQDSGMRSQQASQNANSVFYVSASTKTVSEKPPPSQMALSLSASCS